MKKLIVIALTAAAALTTLSPAEARGGCGIGFHPGPRGACFANRPGGFYRGYGYWDGHRYWQNRVRWQGGWRYR